MGVSDEFADFVIEQLSGWGEVSVHRMFGGAGLYCEGRMFGLIADDVAYLKADDSNRDDFLQAGSSAFQPYPDRKVTMSYYEIPVDVLENRDELAVWAKRSLAISKKIKTETRSHEKGKKTK